MISSTLDDTLAPPGQHVASLFCQHVAPQLPDGMSWDDKRDEVADLMVATVDRYAPGFAASVIGRMMAESAKAATPAKKPKAAAKSASKAKPKPAAKPANSRVA